MRLRILGLFLISMGLLGCKEVITHDGQVPSAYLTQAKIMEGKYYGKFDGKQAEIEIYFEGNRPLVRYSDSRGEDPLDITCNSEIGLLQKVVLRKKRHHYVLDQAIFGFHPGSCRQVNGRTFNLDFSGKNKFTASIYEKKEFTPPCYPGSFSPFGGTSCPLQEYYQYITGRFYR